MSGNSKESLAKKLKMDYEQKGKCAVLQDWLKEFAWSGTNNKLTEMYSSISKNLQCVQLFFFFFK